MVDRTRGKKISRNLRTWILTGLGAILLGGFLAAAGSSLWSRTAASLRPGALEVSIVDQSFDEIGGIFLVPTASGLPRFDTCELKLGQWASTQPGAHAQGSKYRVQITNTTSSDVVLHELRPKLVSTAPMTNINELHCPSGEPMSVLYASADIGTGTTHYFAEDGVTARSSLMYRLSPGEHGVFYLRGFNSLNEGLTTWNAELTYSSNERTDARVNINDVSEFGNFESATLTCSPAWIYSLDRWEDFPRNPDECPTS